MAQEVLDFKSNSVDLLNLSQRVKLRSTELSLNELFGKLFLNELEDLDKN